MTVQVLGEASVDDAAAIVDLLSADVAGLTGGQASQQLRRVAVLAAKIDAYRVELVAKIASSQVWRDSDPNGTPASFLRREQVVDHRQAKADLRAADSLTRFPELGQACRDGRVSREKVDVILSFGLRNPQREAALPEFVSIFIELAAKVTVSDLKRALQLWADQIDPVTTSTDEHDAHRRRELHVHQLGDGVKLDGFFGHDQGMKIMAAINGALDRHRRADNHHENDSQAASMTHQHDADRITHSTAAQRADAFIESIIDPVLESGALPTCGGAPATVCVTVPLQRLRHPHLPAQRDVVKDRMADQTLRLHSAQLCASNGPGETLISATLAQQFACDATVQRVVLSPAGKPLDIGRRTRVIPEQIRTALVIRDGGCVFPLCNRPPGWTEGHHIQHWSQGGPTALNNLILLCSRHHHQVHSENIPIEFDDTGKPRIRLRHTFLN